MSDYSKQNENFQILGPNYFDTQKNYSNSFDNIDLTLLQDVPDQPKSLCKECEDMFIQCPCCNGFFEVGIFCDFHQEKCEKIFEEYKINENRIECLECLSLILPTEVENHKKTCPILHKNEMMCKFCENYFSLSLISEHQNICEMLKNAEYRATTETMCEICEGNVKLCDIEAHTEACQKLKAQMDEFHARMRTIQVEFPSEWNMDIIDVNHVDETVDIMTLEPKGKEFLFAAELLRKTVPTASITNVYRIHNKYLWDRYSKEKVRILEEKGTAEEKFLFHGTKTTKPRALIKCGFDISYANDGCMYGRGVYFAKDASYSYTSYMYREGNMGYLFLAKVITGMSYVSASKGLSGGGSGLKKPPLYNEAKLIYYDSVTNCNENQVAGNSHMYVIYENEKAYPYYLIEINTSINQNNVVNPLPNYPVVNPPKKKILPPKLKPGNINIDNTYPQAQNPFTGQNAVQKKKAQANGMEVESNNNVNNMFSRFNPINKDLFSQVGMNASSQSQSQSQNQAKPNIEVIQKKDEMEIDFQPAPNGMDFSETFSKFPKKKK